MRANGLEFAYENVVVVGLVAAAATTTTIYNF